MGIVRELIEKWFGLDPRHCETCDILREQLYKSEAERKEILARLLDKDKPEPPSVEKEEDLKPILPAFVPWRVRQQMLEAEDRKAFQLKKDRQKEIDALEKELKINHDVSAPSGGVKFDLPKAAGDKE